MRKIAFVLCAAIGLASCSGLGTLPPAPSDIADKTVLDEQAALSVELAYQAAALAVGTATDAGLIRGEAAAKAAEIDRKAYSAVRAVRAAYDAGNSSSYAAAVIMARGQIADLLALIA